MPVKPTDHFGLVETIVSKTSELVAYFDRINEIAEGLDCDVFWRGQADHTWGITSSLVRRMSTDLLTDSDLHDAESAILAESKRWMSSTVVGMQSDLEWLAFLQHNWVPTRLLDFTPDPLVATFFACDSLDDVDGRIFSVLVKRGQPVLDGSVDARIDDTKSGAIQVYRPRPEVSPRLAAQSGVFVLGKLPSTQVRRWVSDDVIDANRPMLKDEVSSVMSLPFYFRGEAEGARPATSAVSAYTARVHITKPSVRRELRRQGAGMKNLKPAQAVDHAYCYPDVDGMRRYSRIWSRLFPQTTSLDQQDLAGP